MIRESLQLALDIKLASCYVFTLDYDTINTNVVQQENMFLFLIDALSNGKRHQVIVFFL